MGRWHELNARWQISARGRRLAGPLLLALACLAAVVYLWRQIPTLRGQLTHFDVRFVVAASLLVIAGQFASATVWRQIVSCFGIQQSWRQHVRYYSYSALGVAIPGSVWVLAGRSALYARAGASGLRVAAATTLEAFVTGVAGLGVYAVTVALNPGVSLWQRPVIGIACAALALVLIQPSVFNGACRWALKRSRQPVDLLAADFGRRQLFVWCLCQAAIITLGGAILFILLRSLVAAPLEVLPLVLMAWSAAVATGNLLFFLPGTLILRDGALLLVLAPVFPLPVVVLFALLSRVWLIVMLFISAGFVWLVFDLAPKLRSAQARRAGAEPETGKSA